VAFSYLNTSQSIADINIALPNQGSPNFFDEVTLAEVQLIRILLGLPMTGSVVIIEAPSDEAIMSIMLSNASKGNFRSMTLKAFPMSEAGKIIERV
jgi:uncharacterized protein with GYD domain